MKTTNVFTRFMSVTALVSALCISSCSSTTAPQTGVTASHALSAGQSFTYHDHAVDMQGNLIPGTDTTLQAVVLQTGVAYAGKTNVSEIIKGTDTSYFVRESDSSFVLIQSQFTIVAGAAMPAIWISFDPAAINKTIYDSTQNVTISGMPAKIHATILINYLGKDAASIGGVSIPILKFSKVVKVTATVYGQDYTTIVTVTNNYAPTLGYLTERDAVTFSDSQYSPVPNGTQYSVLRSFSK